MNKKLTAAILAAMLLLPSCGTTEPPAEDGDALISETQIDIGADTTASETDAIEAYDYQANDLTQFIKLGQYEGLSVTMASAELTDEEFENEISYLLQNYSEYEQITDRDVVEGDVVLADYSGYRDGVQFEGGTATNQTITASGGTGYIEGFAEAFIGQTPGEEFSFNVTFPEDYGNDHAGVEDTFVCTVHSIQGTDMITPELTDEFVYSNFGYNNVEEFRLIYRESVEEQKKYVVESNMYADLWKQIVANAEVTAYPEEEVQRVYNERRSMYESYAGYYGTTYEQILSDYFGITDEDLKNESYDYVKEDLVMYQLLKETGLEITDEMYDARMQFFADYYGTTVDELIAYYGEETMNTTIIWQELMEYIETLSNVTAE
ncbi:MAG: FKBP-type peptidyl-prolyl cis-trans isomerase [Clostridia bacterium]|nr:FKBP-type peptidyl-prolyl cis-trans isomerase [Clostridia bacterium]